MSARNRRRSGFTLIEILVALALGAVLLYLSAQVFATGMRSRDRLRESAGSVAALRRAYETISRDMHSATVPPDDSGLQFGLSATTAGMGTSVLQMASIVGEPMLAGRPASETALIQYAIAEDPRTGRPTLWRYETPYPVPATTSSTSTESERAMALLPGVLQASYLFYSSSQQTWVQTWDGETGLPTAIRIDLEIESVPGREGTFQESWMFTLPAGRYETEEATAAAVAAAAESTQ